MVELFEGDSPGLIDLLEDGKALPGKYLVSEEAALVICVIRVQEEQSLLAHAPTFRTDDEDTQYRGKLS